LRALREQYIISNHEPLIRPPRFFETKRPPSPHGRRKIIAPYFPNAFSHREKVLEEGMRGSKLSRNNLDKTQLKIAF
jgi:hypothetical protein